MRTLKPSRYEIWHDLNIYMYILNRIPIWNPNVIACELFVTLIAIVIIKLATEDNCFIF